MKFKRVLRIKSISVHPKIMEAIWVQHLVEKQPHNLKTKIK